MTRTFAFAAVALLGLGPAALAQGPAEEAASAYTLDTSQSTSRLKVGEKGRLVLVVKLGAPAWHVHPDAPLKVRFDAPEGLALDRSVLGRRDVRDAGGREPRFETAFVAGSRGRKAVTARLDFFICSDTACVKQVRTVPISVDVR